MDSQPKKQIQRLLTESKILIPTKLLPDLSKVKHAVIEKPLDVSERYQFELQLWEKGETIRQVYVKYPKWRSDVQLQQLIASIALAREAKRGRQSFIMLMGNKQFMHYATILVKQLDDKGVDGQIISTLYKMHASGFTKEIKPFTTYKITWIRNLAKKYIEKYGQA